MQQAPGTRQQAVVGHQAPGIGHRQSSRWAIAYGAACTLLLLAFVLASLVPTGCAAKVGSKVATTPKAGVQTNGSPNTVTLSDGDGTWNINSTGPSRYTSLDAKGLTTVQQGTTPRDIYYDRETGRLVISSGTDIRAEGVEFDQAKGVLKLKTFETVGTPQIAALGNLQAQLVEYWTARDQASADVLRREMEAIENVSPTVANMLKDVLRASGVPIP